MVIYCGGTFPLFFFDEQMVIYCGGTFPLFFFDSFSIFIYLFIYSFLFYYWNAYGFSDFSITVSNIPPVC